jgi:hypothetical protein
MPNQCWGLGERAVDERKRDKEVCDIELSCKTAEGKSDAFFLIHRREGWNYCAIVLLLLRYRDTYDTSDTCGTSTVVGSTKRVSPWS